MGFQGAEEVAQGVWASWDVVSVSQSLVQPMMLLVESEMSPTGYLF